MEKIDFSSKEGKNEYQKIYWKNNPEKYQQMLKSARKRKRNLNNKDNCLLPESDSCIIKNTEGINFKDCICKMKCQYYNGERNFSC